MSDHFAQVSTEFHGITIEPAEVSLILEQKELLSKSGGVLTPVEIAAENNLSIYPTVSWGFVSTDIEEIFELYYAQCGKGGDGSISTTIYVLPNPNNLPYKLVVNSGEFSEPITSPISKEETIRFNMTSAVDLGCHVDEIQSIEWEGDTYDSNGGVVQAITPVLDGTSLVTDKVVFGSCRIQYTVFGHTYILTVPMREDKTYQATIMAFYGDNQVETLEVVFPDMSGQCTAGYQVVINPDDPDDPNKDPELPSDDEGDGSVSLQFVAYDTCTGDTIPGATFTIEGSSVPATGHTVKRGVTYSVTASATGYKTNSKSFSV